jgi:uncharacterized membrane-anchored protein
MFRHISRLTGISLVLAIAFSSGRAQDEYSESDSLVSPLDQVAWTFGPGIGEMPPQAEIRVPEGFRFCGADDTRFLMEAMENFITETEIGFLSPDSMDWFAVFEFEEIGYVPDDEKDELDADGLLASMREGSEAANAERRSRGWSELHLVGWAVPPRYNATTNNLEWAMTFESDGSQFVNHNTRLLGRNGVVSVTLVTDLAELDYILPEFKQTLNGFNFKSGNTYAEFTEGDKIAEYGLTALVAGGAAAIAAKSGVFKWLWKVLLIAGAAIAGFFKKFFGKKKTDAPTA